MYESLLFAANPAWDERPTVVDGVSNIGLRVRYPDGEVIPVAVPRDTTAREYAKILNDFGEGYTVLGISVRHHV